MTKGVAMWEETFMSVRTDGQCFYLDVVKAKERRREGQKERRTEGENDRTTGCSPVMLFLP